MRMGTKLFSRVIVITSMGLMSMSALAQAQVMVESPDAGNTRATALPVIAGTTQINGTVGPQAFDALTGRGENDVDMYMFTLNTGGTFTIQVNAAVANEPDMNLMVFNQAGQFLAGDDDDDESCTNIVPFIGGYDSCLTLNLTAGTYYFAVGDNNIGAYESVAGFIADRSSYFASNDSGIFASPSTEIVAIAGSSSGSPADADEQGPYTVYFSSPVGGSLAAPTAIPTMSVYGLILAMLGMMFIAARRLRSSAKRA